MHDYDQIIAKYAQLYVLQIALVRAVIQHESDWSVFAIGDGGNAMGLMQVHRIAAEDVGLASDWDALQAAINAQDKGSAADLGVKIGCAYLAKMLKEFGGLIPWALCAYNQGPTVIGAAKRYAESVMALVGKA